MVLRAMKKLSSMRMKPKNPFLRRVQGMSAEAREKMMKKEGERAKMFEMQRQREIREWLEAQEMYKREDLNKLMAVERKEAELMRRKEIGRAADYLMKKGYSKIQANALATAFGLELAQIKKELATHFGDARAKAITREMRIRLFEIFSDKTNMNNLLRDVRTQDRYFSQSVFARVQEEVFQNHGIPT